MNEKTEHVRKLVLPGDHIGRGRPGHGTYEENGELFAKVIGLLEQRDELLFVIPLGGIYNPKRGDGVIGRIDEISFSKWIVDINSPYQAVLPLNEAVDEFVDLTKSDLTRYFDYNDIIFAEISTVTKTKSVQLSMMDRKCRKLRGGRMIKVTPSKVPRIIGRAGSMVEMIKDITGTQIVVGQNGLVWIKGDNEDIAIEAVLEIEQKSHIQGLTDQIKAMLSEKMGKVENLPKGVENLPKETEDFPNENENIDFQKEGENNE